jgi:hypothetical protein
VGPGGETGHLTGTLPEVESPRPDCYACGLLSRVLPAVHGHFWVARGFLWCGWSTLFMEGRSYTGIHFKDRSDYRVGLEPPLMGYSDGGDDGSAKQSPGFRIPRHNPRLVSVCSKGTANGWLAHTMARSAHSAAPRHVNSPL